MITQSFQELSFFFVGGQVYRSVWVRSDGSIWLELRISHNASGPMLRGPFRKRNDEPSIGLRPYGKYSLALLPQVAND
jgi:hypothetical protein